MLLYALNTAMHIVIYVTTLNDLVLGDVARDHGIYHFELWSYSQT